MIGMDVDFINSRINQLMELFSMTPKSLGGELDMRPAIKESVKELEESGRLIRDRYYAPELFQSGEALLHSDLFANLILRVASHLSLTGFNAQSHSLAKVNKVLHGLDFFPTSPIPAVLKLVHPVGTVIGSTQLKSFSAVYQGVSVGARIPNSDSDGYPVFEGPVILFARSAVFGNSIIGPKVVFGADSMVIDVEVPANTVVVGRYPNHRFLPGGSEIFQKFFKL